MPSRWLAKSDQYAKDVTLDLIQAPARIKAACWRYLNERMAPEKHGIAWDTRPLDEFCDRAAVMQFELMPWQCHAAAVLLARRCASDGTPATRYMLMVVARGAGKTGFVTALCEALMAPGADVEIVCVATKQDKANIIHNRLRKQHKGDDRWNFSGGGGSTTPGLASHKKASFAALPCTDKALDGITARLIVVDEVSRMEAAILRGMSAVTKSPYCQLLAITTPDQDQKHRPFWPFWEQLEKALDNNEPFQEGWWALLWGMEPADDPESERAIQNANPSAGVLVRVQDVQAQIRAALLSGNPNARTEVWTQLLCTFTDELAGALALELLDRVAVPNNWEMLAGAPAVIAIDFSQGGFAGGSQCDLTSITLAAWDGQKVHMRGHHLWAGADIKNDERRTQQPLRQWEQAGHLTVCGGPTIDYDLIEARMEQLTRDYAVRAFVADPVGKAAAWAAQMEKKHGWLWHKAPQTIVWMGGAWSIWSDWIRSQRIQQEPDPVLRSCLNSTRLLLGHTGLAMPTKARSPSNIDAVTSACMAAKVMNDLELLGGSMYENQPGF